MCWQESPIVAQNEAMVWSKDTFIQRCVLLAVATATARGLHEVPKQSFW